MEEKSIDNLIFENKHKNGDARRGLPLEAGMEFSIRNLKTVDGEKVNVGDKFNFTDGGFKKIKPSKSEFLIVSGMARGAMCTEKKYDKDKFYHKIMRKLFGKYDDYLVKLKVIWL